MDRRLLTVSELELGLAVALGEDRGDDARGRFALMRVLKGPQLVVDLFDLLVVALYGFHGFALSPDDIVHKWIDLCGRFGGQGSPQAGIVEHIVLLLTQITLKKKGIALVVQVVTCTSNENRL